MSKFTFKDLQNFLFEGKTSKKKELHIKKQMVSDLTSKMQQDTMGLTKLHNMGEDDSDRSQLRPGDITQDGSEVPVQRQIKGNVELNPVLEGVQIRKGIKPVGTKKKRFSFRHNDGSLHFVHARSEHEAKGMFHNKMKRIGKLGLSR